MNFSHYVCSKLMNQSRTSRESSSPYLGWLGINVHIRVAGLHFYKLPTVETIKQLVLFKNLRDWSEILEEISLSTNAWNSTKLKIKNRMNF